MKQGWQRVAQADVALRPHCLKFLQSGIRRFAFVFIAFIGIELILRDSQWTEIQNPIKAWAAQPRLEPFKLANGSGESS